MEREQQQKYVAKLRTELKELDIDTCTIPDEQLGSWAVRTLSPLDVDADEESTGPLFFRPMSCPLASHDEIIEVAKRRLDNWEPSCRARDTPKMFCDAHDEATYRSSWFRSVLAGVKLPESTDWRIYEQVLAISYDDF